MRQLASPLTAAIALGPLLALGGGVEDFDAPGSAWSDTLFPNEFGNGAFTRDALTAAHGAPNTVPPLPINQGGDKEARYFSLASSGSSTAYGDAVYCDVRVEAFLGIGDTGPLGSFVGLQVRGGLTPLPGGYVAAIYQNVPGVAFVALSLRCNALIHVDTVLATSVEFPVDPANENYRMVLEAQGPDLRVTLFRVTASGGALLEEPIDLSAAPGIQNELFASDTTYAEGTIGLYCFALEGDSVFVDDLTIEDLGCGPGLTYCSGDGADAPCPCNNDTETGEGCRNSTGVGARIAAQGTTSVAADDLFLTASQVPRHQNGLIFAGTTQLGIPFGDGLRCIGGEVFRFPIQSSGACGTLHQAGAASSIGIAPGETWHFGGWFRDPLGPCGAAFNFTHGLALSFLP